MDPAAKGGKRSAWMSHVKMTMKANKGKSLKQVLKMAGKTYKKSKKGGAGGVGGTAMPLGGMEGGRRRRGGEEPGFKIGGRRRTRKANKSRKH
jgi:hypothetical protein